MTTKKDNKVPQANSLGVLAPPSPHEMSRTQERLFIDQAVSCQLLLDEVTNDDLPYLYLDPSTCDTIRAKIEIVRQHLHKMEGLLP
jgi:hypothetical protein